MPVPGAPRAGLALLLASCLALAHADGARAQELLDGIAAQVGSEVVLISDVNQVARPALRGIEAQGASERDVAMLKAEVLERMIERALIRQIVRRAELEATDAEVDQAIGAIASENGLDVEQLRESVEAQGLPFEAYRQRIKEEIEHSKVMNGMVGSRVRIEEEEVRALYAEEYSNQPESGEEVRIRHILVSADPGRPESVERACARVSQAAERVRAGEPFPQVAADVSEVNPKQGGEFGWVHRRFLAAWMGPIVDAMQPGEVSDVIPMEFGCNLMQLVDRRTYDPVDYEEVRGQLRRRLFSQRMEKHYKDFIEELRSNTYIERKGVFAEATRLETDGPEEAGASSLPEPELPETF